MKIKTDARRLLAAIEEARGFTLPHSTAPALRCVKVSAEEDGKAYVAGDSIDCGVRIAVPALVAFGDLGAACFQPGEVAALLKGAEGVATLSGDDQNARVEVRLVSLKVEAIPASDFVAWIDPPEDSALCTLDASALARALDAVLPAAGIGERPSLCAVHFESPTIDGVDAVTLVATDGRRMHVSRVPARGITVPKDAEGPAVSADIPIDAARKLRKAIARRKDAEVRIAAHAEIFAATVPGSFQFRAKCSKSKFPDWRLAIDGPAQGGADGVFSAPARPLLASLARFIRMGFDNVRIGFTSSAVELCSSSRPGDETPVATLREAVPAKDADAMGEPILFDPKILADGISACGTADVVFCRRKGCLVPIVAFAFGGSVEVYLMALHE